MIFYKDDATIYGKVLCTHCGIYMDLMYVQLSAINPDNNRITSYETVICRDCYRELPERADENESTN